ncbi:MAG: hypothetical protein GY860_17760, partial [Desulfobacteraceae bacterium]|nr:hypothetical protein [Desulfobacteraceae bacterium]
MKRLNKLKPAFWNQRNISGGHFHTAFNFQRKWKLIVLITSFMALSPLFVMTLVDFSLTRRVIEDEVKAGMSKILNLTAASISFSSDLEKTAMDYIDLLNSGDNNDTFVINENGTLLT